MESKEDRLAVVVITPWHVEKLHLRKGPAPPMTSF